MALNRTMTKKYNLNFLFLLLVFNCNGQSLIIAYSGNLNGYLEPCDCQEAYLGGMTRFITAVDSLRHLHPDLLLVDSGDFFKSYPLSAGNWLMLEMLNYLKYDAITLGDQELVEGIDFLTRGIDHFRLPVLASNLKVKDTKEEWISSSIILRKGDLRIGVFAVIDSSSFEYSPVEGLKIAPIEDILQESLPLLRPQVDLLLLLCHAGFNRAVCIAERFPEIDVIIAGHSQERSEMTIGKQMVLQSGYDGEFLGILKIDFLITGLNFQNYFLPLSAGFAENEYFKGKIRQAFINIETEK
jgi:2',3'-cyclic-nucleotide 2'-phosphodiesterase (5'-nucleotidase family)